LLKKKFFKKKYFFVPISKIWFIFAPNIPYPV